MFDFFSSSIYWKSYTIDNLLVAKLLYDRGFNVTSLEIGEPILGPVLEMLFGGEDHVIWGPIEPNLPEEAERILEKANNNEELTDDEEEASYYITNYAGRDHYRLEIKIDDLAELYDKLRPKHYRQLMDTLKKVSYTSNENFNVDLFEDYFPYYELVEEIEWLKDDGGRIIGFWLHFVDVESGTEEPISDLRYHEAFIKFWDTLQVIKKKVSNNYNNKNSKRRQHILKPRGEGGNQGKTDRPGLPPGTGEEHAA